MPESTALIIDDILAIVAAKAGIERDKISRETLLKDLNVGSLDMVEIIFAIEEALGIEMPFNANTAARDFRSIGDVIQAVERITTSKPAQ